MAQQLIITPIVVILLLTVGLQLVDIAEASSNQVIEFSAGAANNMECALNGIPMSECSDDLLWQETVTKEDISGFIDVVNITYVNMSQYIDAYTIEE